MARRGGRDRCPYDRKSTFKSRKRASRTARRLEDANLYWCPQAGGWHLTSLEPGEYDHRRALGMRGQLETEIDLHPEAKDQPTDCPICHEHGGFHDSTIHFGHQVPTELTWNPGEKPLWQKE